MTTALSNRDKRLLYLVALVGFAVLFARFALAPAITAYAEARQALADAEALQRDMQYALSLPTTDQTAARALADRGTADAAYYTPLTNDELDGLVTGLEITHGLVPRDLQITAPAAVAVSSYPLGTAEGTAADSAAAESITASADSAVTDSTAGTLADTLAQPVTPDTTYLQTALVTCTAGGTRDQFRALLDDLAANYPAIRLVSFSASDTTYATADAGTQTDTQFTYTLAIYLCDKAADHAG